MWLNKEFFESFFFCTAFTNVSACKRRCKRGNTFVAKPLRGFQPYSKGVLTALFMKLQSAVAGVHLYFEAARFSQKGGRNTN